MSTRIDRLFCLLQDGQNPLVRQTAAQQIGEICEMDPNKVDTLLDRSYNLLFSNKWESRTAAGQVFEEILKHVAMVHHTNKNEETFLALPFEALTVQGYDIKKIINNPQHLVESNTNQTYLDVFLKHNHIHTKNDLISLLILERIGLISDNEILTLNTLKSQYIQLIENKQNNDIDIDIDIEIIKDDNLNLQKIETYLEKLKETESKENENNLKNNDKKLNKLKDEDFKLLMTLRSSLHPKNTNSNKTKNKQCVVIIFSDWYKKLVPYLLHSNWKYRHGAAIGLRSLLKTLLIIGNHSDNHNANENNNNIFIEGCLMCLSVLLLDRFFDFQSDILVAPISETVAQCFSLFLKYTSNNRHFLQLFNLLIECLDIKRVKTWSWHIRYCSYLALKYILPLHYMQIIAFKNDKLIKNIISLTCNGLKDEMEDVCNMSSQVLLSVISLFDNVNINVDNMQNVIFDSLLYALNQIDEYFGSTISVLNVLNCVFNQFTELINEYVNDKKHHYVFSNIFNILLSIMNNSSICMKKQVILTLHKFIQFVINKNIINEKQIISLIETIFDKIMSEQHSDIKQSIEVLKDDNDFDEYEMYLQYAEYMNHLQSLWNYICSNLQHLILIQHNNTNSLPMQYQQMILKLFNSLQKHAILKKQSNSNDNDNDNDKKEEQRLPTSQLLEKIEQLKNSKNNKKRKRMDENENKMEPPIATKKRKLNSNKCENKKRIDIKTTNHETDFLYPSEIILWSVIDSGCILLSQLFCCHALHPLSWDIVQYLLLQFLSQRKKQKHKKKKHIIYGWRRIIGCWLLSDCYFELKKYLKNKNEIEIEMKENDKIINMINTLRNVKHNDIYQEYDELKMRRQMITYHTNNLILTFKHNDNVSNEMNKYFNNLQFDEYVHALTNKYNEWKSIEKKENKNENNNNNNKERKDCYKLLLATVLNAEYALDSHDLLLQCSMSNILITNGNIINILQLNIESVLQPLLLALKSTNKRLNLQYRAAHSLALAMKLLSDNHQTQILEKVFNSLLADCGQNTQYKARDNIRMVIQCICDLFMDENIFDKLSFIINKMKNILMDYDDCDWIAMAQIFACFISSIKSKDIKTKYLQPLIENVMICNTVFMIEDEDDVNYGICAQSRYCILQYLYQEPNVILPLIIKQVIPKLYCDDICFRLGALELIWDILYSIDNIQCVETEIKHKNINKCQRYENYSQLNVKENQKTLLMQILSYLSSLIVPLLSQMTDFNNKIRKRANQIFSIAVRFIPLEQGLNLDNDNKDRKILQQLIDPSVIDEYQCPFQYDATLRHYQQDGINWLWFLNKFHLHGILADDMGLGKTLQTLLIITASYHINTNTNTNDPLPSSLIVCPSTLVYHWLHEINKFIPNLLVPFIIDGNPRKRRGLYCKLKEENGNSKKNNYIVIMSYNTMKNDISYINANCNVWHYCVLDEGHLIKNPKAKISISVKTIASKYRLILSGTPIQNNVLDLWSLFDFLMPGFLGNESWFKKNFSSPIIASYKAKAKNNNNKQRVAALKLQRLHKQVLPFILRRLKCDVLKELPPKIIQDVEVDMSSIQKTLYKHFVNSDKFEAISSINNTMNTKNNNQSMQSLIYMRKLVVHPKLIMTKQHPLFHQIIHDLQKDNLSLECIDISPKFVALKSLIEQCICDKSHRMLIFVQYRQVITLIESLLLSQYFPDLPYKTLTGKLTNAERFDVVKEFNAKNSRISLLLLTVNVGGLGLNLSSANIIIFMEHDWNPMKDLQAMDRAHRIGQTKTVHVFRIIVRNTIEWEIMNKQRFKQHIANTVISKENASLSSITTGSGSILDLFYMNNSKNNKNDNDNNDGYANGGVDALGKVHEKTKKQKALDSMLDTLGNMTTINQQYQNEYDLKKFISDLK